MAENFANTYQTTLNDAGGISAGDTSMVVTSATGAPAANFRVKIESELILVTVVAGTTFTITRGIEGTTAASHADGATVTHVLTAGVVQTISDRMTLVHLTANETGKTDATLVNTGLSFAVTSSTYYSFRFYIVYRSTVGTVGLKLGLTYPAATIFAAAVKIHDFGAAGAGNMWSEGLNFSGDATSSTAAFFTGTNLPAVIEGVLLPSADGTLMVQYAAETTGATVTMMQASTGELIKHA